MLAAASTDDEDGLVMKFSKDVTEEATRSSSSSLPIKKSISSPPYLLVTGKLNNKSEAKGNSKRHLNS